MKYVQYKHVRVIMSAGGGVWGHCDTSPNVGTMTLDTNNKIEHNSTGLQAKSRGYNRNLKRLRVAVL
eukprot:scaffold15684_cov147-Skeletonema_marinoi.AAC.2